ncbi:MAG: GTPase/DUF3482 domain-containing protein [Wenzhouxiangellaceae bacterium]|nr:GTPase/DUF3482 domain-containing protein [Wenzhouxiangellaceae bacterium]
MNSVSPVAIAVVGHTNVGKTSLVRTLMREARFGEVAATASTTRQVQAARLWADGRAQVELLDTPGLEDAPALIERLDARASERHGGPERVRAFLTHADARGRFEQEARVLAQVLDSDCALYVIDAREPVLGKYQDELAILALCARPILPVLNFVAQSGHRAPEWREALARVGLHTLVEFDSVVFSLDAECRLWQRLATLLDAHGARFEALIEDRRRRATLLRGAALRRIAELLIDSAAACRFARREDEIELRKAGTELAQSIANHERAMVDDLLELTGFSRDAHAGLELPIDSAAWRAGAFHADQLERLGRSAGSAAAAGAATGAALDLALGGLSLGAATLLGAIAGGGAGGAWQLRHAALDRLRGRTRVQADDRVIVLLAARALALLNALEQRGHAAQTPLALAEHAPPPWLESGLPNALQRARRHPELSPLNPDMDGNPALREQLADELATALATSQAPAQDKP